MNMHICYSEEQMAQHPGQLDMSMLKMPARWLSNMLDLYLMISHPIMLMHNYYYAVINWLNPKKDLNVMLAHNIAKLQL